MNTKAFSIALLTVLIWGSSFAAIRVGLKGGYSAGHLILIRYLIASLLFAVYALLPGVKFRLPRKEDLLKILILGWIGISIYHIGVTFGERTVSAGTAGMLIGSGPIFTSLLAMFVLKERLGKWGWIGLIIGFVGIFIITLGSSGDSFKISKEAFFILVAAFATSVMFVYQKSLYSRYTSMELTAYFTWAGTLPFFIFFPGIFHDIQHATLEASFSAIYIGIFPTAIGYVTWAIALAAGKASSVSSMLYLEPIVAIVVAWFWIHEWPNTISIIGGIIAISGVVVVNLKGRERAAVSENTPSSTI
ncbi:DMT family transporter [Bacillus sp. BRMEA1]|uniref:DMT family transporter n=1 Tax=Neobacillus endophyticus TaxID=2738405 RepID=UPI001567B88A|nr:DMT family transporter [Neobacillus endophyticus]NRD77857.1 DMT family transporter [Neobacillus endophyticus]